VDRSAHEVGDDPRLGLPEEFAGRRRRTAEFGGDVRDRPLARDLVVADGGGGVEGGALAVRDGGGRAAPVEVPDRLDGDVGVVAEGVAERAQALGLADRVERRGAVAEKRDGRQERDVGGGHHREQLLVEPEPGLSGERVRAAVVAGDEAALVHLRDGVEDGGGRLQVGVEPRELGGGAGGPPDEEVRPVDAVPGDELVVEAVPAGRRVVGAERDLAHDDRSVRRQHKAPDVSGDTLCPVGARAGGVNAPGQQEQRRAATEQPDSDAARVVAVDGHGVAYASFGDPDGAPVVAFHGTPGSRAFGRLYDDAARERGVRVLAFSRPGYGDSDPWPGFDAGDAPRVVAAVLDDAGVDAAGLLAFSGGAAHALATAADAPERADGVTVVAGATPPGHVDDPPTAQRVLGGLAAHTPRLLGGLLRGQAWAAGRADPGFVAAQYTTDGTDHLPADVLDATRRDFLQALSGGADGAVRESRQAVREWPLALSDVAADVRWLHGRDDANVPLDAARSTVGALPEGSLDVLDTDHLGAVAAARDRALARHA